MITWDDLTFFNTELFDRVVDQLLDQEEEGRSILPQNEDIFNALAYTPFSKVKVVILGQDPYPNISHAHGFAFSVPEDVHPYPASLRNIFRELQDDVGCSEPTSGCLIPWAKQGVLLLNTSLTVIEGSIGSHASIGWHNLVNEAMCLLSQEHKHLVYILWGKNAQAKSTYISRQKEHLLIRSAHPSPLAANKGGFFGTHPFSRTNTFLEEKGIPTIDWCLD